MKRALALVAALFAALWSHADVPQLINYQGRLLDGTNLVSGSAGLSLRLFNAPAGGARLYEDSNSVTVVDGLYSTFIGDNTTSGSLSAALTNAQVWIEVAVNGAPLAPRERLAAVGYALVAEGVKAGGVTADMMATGAVQSAHIADGTITLLDLANNSVGSSKIADGAISDADINARAAIEATKIAHTALVHSTTFGGDVAGLFGNLQLGAGVVGNGELAANAVTSDKIATNIGFWTKSGSNLSYSAGRVGVGTASPGGDFHAYRATGDLNAFFETDSGDAQVYVDGSDDAYLAFRKSGVDKGNIGYRTVGDYLYLWNGGYVVLKAGNLGVGTETPESKLHVLGNVTVNQKIIADDSGGLELATDDGVTRLFVDDSGRVGIGTSLPSDDLHILATNGNADLRVDSYGADAHVKIDAATGTPAVEFLENHAIRASVGYSIASDYAYINEGGSNVVFDNGRVGIGTASPSNSLTVNGSVSVSGPCYGTFPRPAYDSGWVGIGFGGATNLIHNVGQEVDNYKVDLQFKDLDGLGINTYGNGIFEAGTEYFGGYYFRLTTSNIIVAARSDFIDQVRVRIWTYK